MLRTVRPFLLAAALHSTMALPAIAQDATTTAAPAPTASTTDDDGFDWGWLGLLGLIGLAGLRGKRRDDTIRR